MGDENESLLDQLVNPLIPRSGAEPPAPVEPREPEEPKEPEEPAELPDLAARERAPAREEAKAPAAKADPATVRVKVRGQEYTLQQLAELGMLKDLATVYEQYPHLQQKYQSLLEKQTRPAETKEVEKPAAPKQVTASDILQVYSPRAVKRIQELIEQKLIEDDINDAYPKTLLLKVANDLFLTDMIFEIRQALAEALVRLEEGRQEKHAEATNFALENRLNEVAEQGKEYEALNTPKTRQEFKHYLRQLQPLMRQVFGDDGVKFLSRQFIAFNAEAISEAAKANSKKAPTDKVKAKGESGGGGPRVSHREEPKSVMDRLIDTRLPQA